MNEEAIDEWRRSTLLHQVEGAANQVGATVSLRPLGQSLSLGSVPEGTRLEIDVTGKRQVSMTAQVPPSEISLTTSDTVEGVAFQNVPVPIPSMEIIGHAGNPIRVISSAIERLSLRHGSFALGTVPAVDLTVESCTLEGLGPPLKLQGLTIAGSLSVRQTDIEAQSCATDGPVNLDLSKLTVYELRARDEVTIRRGQLSIQNDVEDLKVKFLRRNGGLELAGEFRRPRFNGGGTISILKGSVLRQPLFDSPNIPARLIATECEIFEAEGRCQLLATRSLVEAADNGSRLQLVGIEDVTGSELHDIDIYGLQLDDVDRLKDVLRISPWFPPRWGDAKKAEDGMFGGESTNEARRRRAQFWAKLSTLLKEKHGTGNDQSVTRAAAMRTRQAATRSGRERNLLWIYQWVGYGESVAKPILWLLAVSTLAALTLLRFDKIPATSNALEVFGGIVVLPLSFFRFIDPLTLEGWPQAIVVVAAVVNVLMLFFTLSAIRRVTKAE